MSPHIDHSICFCLTLTILGPTLLCMGFTTWQHQGVCTPTHEGKELGRGQATQVLLKLLSSTVF